MKTTLQKVFLLLASAMVACAQPALGAGKIRIVTSIPDLADMAREVGRELVDVESLATGVEDPHGIPIKPSFVTKLNRADCVILMGMENEHSYMPALLEAAKNPRIQKGKPGYIDTSKGITPLDVPANLSRSEGEVHPAGNPHYNLDPVMGRVMVQNICQGLARHFPEHEAKFSAYCAEYLAKLDPKIAEWQRLAAGAAGLKFVSHHPSWPYFAKRFGFRAVGTIEPKPGVEPGARHITDLVAMMKAEGVKVVVREPQFSEKVPNRIAAQAGAKAVKLAIMVGGVPEARTYIDLIDYNLRTLLNAAKP
jgi:zinc/manganese transport system substrate-binding protein